MNTNPPEPDAPENQGLRDFLVKCDGTPKEGPHQHVFHLVHTISLPDGYLPHMVFV